MGLSHFGEPTVSTFECSTREDCACVVGAVPSQMRYTFFLNLVGFDGPYLSSSAFVNVFLCSTSDAELCVWGAQNFFLGSMGRDRAVAVLSRIHPSALTGRLQGELEAVRVRERIFCARVILIRIGRAIEGGVADNASWGPPAQGLCREVARDAVHCLAIKISAKFVQTFEGTCEHERDVLCCAYTRV